ncbi:hypothetical protein X798_01080 [Onchocerca flexuosa]|uniref:Uncharacterized protein n=1 Tax=Onchocerca flexuosa TaxID=387005 RepID=A0A238C372_9BILA|nr:hypothetical protein X798_01080 [Onchocerca flexuosa]
MKSLNFDAMQSRRSCQFFYPKKNCLQDYPKELNIGNKFLLNLHYCNLYLLSI